MWKTSIKEINAMILVFCVLAILIIINLIILLILFSNIKVIVDSLKFTYQNKNIEIDLDSKIALYLFNKVKLFEYKIDEDKIKESMSLNKINIEKLKENKEINKIILKEIKNSNYSIEKFNIEGILGTEDSALTAISYGIINSIIPIYIMKKINDVEDYKNEFKSVYINRNIINIKVNLIVNIKIIYLIFTILKIYQKKNKK